MAAALPKIIDVQEHRATLMPQAHTIWRAAWSDIESFELIPGQPISSDLWVLPPHWASGGTGKLLGQRRVSFAAALPTHWDRSDQRAELVLRRLKRLACLMFFCPARTGDRYRGPPKPSTWVGNLRPLMNVARMALEIGYNHASVGASTCPDGPMLFVHLSPSQLLSLKEKNRNFAHAVIPRLNGLFLEGFFDDWPASDVAVVRPKKSSGWAPFNDEFTSELCSAAIWMMKIGPDLLECWEGLRRLDGLRKCTRTKRDLRRAFLSTWEGNTLKTGYRFPFSVNVRAHDGTTNVSRNFTSWPLSHPAVLRGMIVRLQEAHGILISLGIGSRDSEVTDLPRDCLIKIGDDHDLAGYTFKLSDNPNGEVRHWPLPRLVVDAVRQQQLLAQVIDPDGPYLFVAFRKGNSIEDGKRSQLSLKSFAHQVSLRDGRRIASLCDGNVHSHRFRKTVVRLAALSLVGANQILFDILGHRDPEMTLNYILSEPKIQDEMRQIAREASIAMAEDVLRSAGANGGPAAARVDELAARFIPRSGSKEMDVAGMARAAEILSQGGRVMLVRAGVLCTKTFNQAGPCTKRGGNPDIGNCNVGCLHRLELASARADHRRSIELILESIPNAEDHFMRGWWQEQLVAHLTPFQDLRTEMLGDSRVQDALRGIPEVSMLKLLTPPGAGAANPMVARP